MDNSHIRALIAEVRQKFPPALWSDFLDRDVLHIRLSYVPGGKVIDLGGGYSPMSAVLAKLGMDVTVVDTFASTRLYEQFSAQQLCEVLQSFGVKLIKADLRDYDPVADFELNSADAVVCFGTIFFFNPRQLLDRSLRVLKPRGKLILEYNNGASLVRRMRLLLGRNNTETFAAYYVHDWHRRFWVKPDLLELSDYLKLSDRRVVGRNWSWYEGPRRLPQPVMTLADRTLRTFPGLCNVLYLVGTK
jgi:SAM-dependent methyltransferase